MATNTPVGVLRAIVIFPSCMDATVAHRLLRQTSTRRTVGHNELCDRKSHLDDGQTLPYRLGKICRPSTKYRLELEFRAKTNVKATEDDR